MCLQAAKQPEMSNLSRISSPVYLYAPAEWVSADSEEKKRGSDQGRKPAVAVTWTKERGYQVFRPDEFKELKCALRTADEVVGFDFTSSLYKTLLRFRSSEAPLLTDLFQLLSRHGEEPISLRSSASATFGRASLVDKEKLVELWNAGKPERVIRASKRRVGIIRKLHEHVLLHRQFRFYDTDGDVIRIYMDSDVVPSGRFPDERQSVLHWSPAACFARARQLDRAVAAFKRTGKLPKL